MKFPLFEWQELRRHRATALLAIGSAVVILSGPYDPCCGCCLERSSYRVSGRTDLLFEPNLGQAETGYEFLTRARGMHVFLDPTGVALDLRKEHGLPAGMLRVQLAGSNARPVAEPEGLQPGRVNYFLGEDPSRWMTDIPTFSRIRYKNVYPGIDAVYYGRAGELEHDFVVRPGADPHVIRMEFSGAGRAHQEPDGSLVFHFGSQTITWRKPLVYQKFGDTNRAVEGRYRLEPGGKVGFEVGVYDLDRNLIIDPVVSFSTYLGRGNPDVGTRLAVDGSGNTYMTGVTFDGQYPISPGAFTPAPGGTQLGNVIVTKLSATGGAIVYSTHIGGVNTDGGLGIAVDSAGNAYVAGGTDSPDFPVTQGVIQTRNNSRSTPNISDCFVTKLNAAGNALIWSTYLGGPNQDLCSAVAVDSAGNAFVTGLTSSTNLPASETAFQRAYRGGTGNLLFLREGDAFVAKISTDGSRLSYLSYLGGTSDDGGTGIAVDEQGNAYVTGVTNSVFGFPVTSGALQQRTGGAGGQGEVSLGDAFVSKVSPDGSTLVYSTLLGGSRDDAALSIAVDSQGNAHVAGSTLSANFPTTTQAYQREYKGEGGESKWIAGDAFVAKLNPAGSALVWSTLLGGSADDRAVGVVLDSSGNVHITGNTLSRDFPTTSDAASRTYRGNDVTANFQTGDAFVAQLNSSGSAIVYSSYLGGAANDWGMGIAVDRTGTVSIAGGTSSRDFPTTAGAIQPGLGGAPINFLPTGDAFLLKLSERAAGPAVSISAIASAASGVGGSVAPGEIVAVSGTNVGPQNMALSQVTAAGTVATRIGDTQVLFDNVPAPILYTSGEVTGVVVPYAVAGRTNTVVVVEARGGRSAPVTIPVVASKPALFAVHISGRGPGAILNEDYTLNTADNPSESGKSVYLFGTGEGQTNPSGVEGRLAMLVMPRPVLPVSASIAGRTADVLSATAVANQVAGLLQVKATVPGDAPTGQAEVFITIGTARSQPGVTMWVR